MIIEHLLEVIIPFFAGILEAVGVFVIVLGALKGIYLFVKNGFNFGDQKIAVEMARAMSLSLSFLLAGEILHSILTRTIEGLIVLVGIASLRVGLHFALHWEIKEGCKEDFDKKVAKNI